ncbi:hypothetical protein L486_07040 [Kwoniella mangroviensis CBS 10435]|uniref:Uncharacterized protein n=1 Tax=Kwoniella mangroviensis CBS 10435 TaxID=1331196 RepID=A0A1B9IIU9_9TREE|nr:hypothetical protein L486_07040 [Kwoniella mangroviensis CBS 10435]
MVKRSLSTSPPPSSPEQIKPSSPFSSIDERSSPKKSPRKSNTINNNKESWDADKRSVVAEMILEAGFKPVLPPNNFEMLSNFVMREVPISDLTSSNLSSRNRLSSTLVVVLTTSAL